MDIGAAGIVQSTLQIEKDNINRLKSSAIDLANAFKEIGDDFNEHVNKLQDGNLNKDDVQSIIDVFKSADVGQLKNLNFGDIDNIFSKLADTVDDSTEEGKKLKSKFNDLQQKTDQVIHNAKSMLTLAYTMPAGIRSSNLHFELSVDALRYARMSSDTASVAMDVHATWVLPWTISDGVDANVVSFKGDNVVLKGNGSSQIKIADGNEKASLKYQTYTLSKDKIYLDLDTSTYVEIDCDGFKQMHLSGRIRFSSDLIKSAVASQVSKDNNVEPTKDQLIADSIASVVSASFGVTVSDLNDIVFEAQLDKPFKIKVTDDIIYTAQGLVVDFSTQRNGENFAFPKGYISPFVAGDDVLWTGFAIKTLKVDLSEEFPDFPLKSVAAYNMLIDETGVSGWFEASAEFGKSSNNQGSSSQNIGVAQNSDTNQNNNAPQNANTSQGKNSLFGENSTIQAKFESISLGLSSGKISGGGLKGQIIVKPLTDDNGTPLTLGMDAEFYTDSLKGLSFVVETKLEKDMKRTLPVLKTTTILIGAGSAISYSKTLDTTGQYKKAFVLTLNGGMDMNNKVLQVDGLRFENLKFSSAKPHFSSGNFSLNSIATPELHGLTFGLKNISAQSSETEALLNTDIYLQIIGKESSEDSKQGVAVEGSFQVVSDIDDKWHINGLRMQGINIDVSYSAFRLKGGIKSFRDHQIYGDGFEGNLGFSMKTPRIAVDVEAKFGKTNYIDGTNTTNSRYRYWFAYASADIPPQPIFPPAVLLNYVSLALYSKMDVKFDMNEFKLKSGVPNKGVAFGFEAGVGVCVAQDNLINAKAKLGMEFSSSGGVGKVFLNGKVAVVSKEQADGLLTGSIGCTYNFKDEILMIDASVSPGEKVKKIVQGKVDLKLRTYPNSWYCNIGTYNNPCNLTFAEKIKTKTYMMFGDSVPSVLPPLDPQISAKFNVTQSTATSTDHSEDMSNGIGFAFGAALSVGCNLNAFVYADVSFKGGTDLLVVRKPGFICENSKYRASGRVFVYLDVGAGIKFRRKKYEVVEFCAAANLEGELPKPFFVHGDVYFSYRLLGGLLKGSATANFEAGSKCSWSATGDLVIENTDPNFFNETELVAPDEVGDPTLPDEE